jgi:GH15 family glucan-1,4-alpha-glucosidase
LRPAGRAQSRIARTPQRRNGYLPIRDYAAVGDGRTLALVGLDGAIDWLCLPNMDSPSVFGALLDPDRSGSFELEPAEPYEAARSYAADTNVLETTFESAGGVVRVTDALTLSDETSGGARELVRRIEGLAGTVPMRWRAQPRLGYGLAETELDVRSERPVAVGEQGIVSLSSWDAGEPTVGNGAIEASFALRDATRALLVLGFDEREPAAFPHRDEAETRLDRTHAFWQQWSGERTYDGPWREQVLRSALALKLLIFAPSGAIAAAPTTSLPEVPGGDSNWDYRFCWVRDASFMADSLLELGCGAEARALLSWIMRASEDTHPELQVVYRLDGSPELPEQELPLAGYDGARPVRVGNSATDQLQVGIYGDLLESAWLYVENGNELEEDEGRRLAETADLLCELWRTKDSGIWEDRDQEQHFTESKLMSWVALDRAYRLAADGHLPAAAVPRWQAEAREIERFVEQETWSESRRSYTRCAGSDELDASGLLAAIVGYEAGGIERVRSTVEAIRSDLGRGPFVWRYRTDGQLGTEGAFLACSFWLVMALAVTGSRDEAGELMEELLPAANDVGLYSEEIDPESGDLLGNFPQGLTHLALIGAAQAVTTGKARL